MKILHFFLLLFFLTRPFYYVVALVILGLGLLLLLRNLGLSLPCVLLCLKRLGTWLSKDKC